MTPELIQQKIFFGYAKAATKLGATFNIYRSSTPINPIVSGNLIGPTQMSTSVTWDYMKANSYDNAVWNACLDAQSANAPNSCQVGDYLIPTTGSDVTYYVTGAAVASGGSGYSVGDVIILSGGISTQLIILTVATVSAGAVASVVITQAGSFIAPLPSNPVSQYYSSGTGTGATFTISWTQVGGIDDNSTYFVQVLQFDLPPRVVKCNKTLSIIRPSQTTGAGYIGYAGYTPSTSVAVMTAMPASVLKHRGGSQAPTKLPTDTQEPTWIILLPNLGGVIVRVGDIIIDDVNEEYVVSDNELTELGWRIIAQQVVNSR